MTPADFEFLSGVIKDRSGLVLTPDKLYLLESRLTPVARNHSIAGLTELVAAIRANTNAPVVNDVVEAMTTNESFFFRDSHMFDRFRDEVLPELIANRQGSKRLRIWCAAASSGQEPYSIAMIFKEAGAALAGWQVEIIGTDISLEILNRARSGVYTQFEVQRGVPTAMLLKYFEREGDGWRITEEIRSMVQYKPFNLLEDLNPLGKFDVVFCRNVLIYFDQPTKQKILQSISRMLPPDGALLLGGAETVLGLCEDFKPNPSQRGIYRLEAGASAAPTIPTAAPGAVAPSTIPSPQAAPAPAIKPIAPAPAAPVPAAQPVAPAPTVKPAAPAPSSSPGAPAPARGTQGNAAPSSSRPPLGAAPRVNNV